MSAPIGDAVRFSESTSVSEDQPVYTHQEWQEFLRGWRGSRQQQQQFDSACQIGVKDLDICSVEYPCWVDRLKLCYDLEGVSHVVKPEKAGDATRQIRETIARRKRWRDFLQRERDMRGSHDFDQMMDRKELVRLQKGQRPSLAVKGIQ